MIEMRVDSIQLDPRNMQPILVLCDQAKVRALPIWIGSAEANAIGRTLLDVESSRPKTHELLLNTISLLGYKVKHVEINDLNEDTFYSTIRLMRTVDGQLEEKALDSRPSDAVALALIAEVPIFVSPAVVLESTYPVDEERDEAEASAFKDFVKKITASDFNRHAAVRSDDTCDQPAARKESEDRRPDAA
jgi:bifunctional DNase/RNase